MEKKKYESPSSEVLKIELEPVLEVISQGGTNTEPAREFIGYDDIFEVDDENGHSETN